MDGVRTLVSPMEGRGQERVASEVGGALKARLVAEAGCLDVAMVLTASGEAACLTDAGFLARTWRRE